jgi:ribosome-associated protein
MKDELLVNDTIIPEHELEIATSRAGGPGGQHVNKTSTRITVRWNVKNSAAFTDEQKERIINKLQSQLTTEGDIIVHNSSSRSQAHNKKMARAQLIKLLSKALHVPKKRRATRIPQGAQESRLRGKAHRSDIKKMRSSKISND